MSKARSTETYFSLKEWVKKDLVFSVSQKPSFELLKKQLSNINFNDVIIHESLQKKIEHILEADEESINDLLQELYLDCFFTLANYDKYMSYLKNGNETVDSDKKLKGLNYMHNYCYMSLLSDDPRALTQMERASVITKAALDLYENFKKSDYKTYLNPKGLLNTHLYKYFFATNIRLNLDSTIDVLHVNQHSAHIIVMFNGQAFKLRVIQNDRFISVDELKSAFEKISELEKSEEVSNLPIGVISTASRFKRFALRKSKFLKNKESFEDLENALFILCLDTKPYCSMTGEQILSYQFHNRYYGNTQIVIGLQGECGVITNYATVDGTQAIEIIDTIYQNSLKINCTNSIEHTSSPSRLTFSLTPEELKTLETDTQKILHEAKSDFTLDFGVDFFKSLLLNPNITMNFLVMLAVHEIADVFPVTNHAVSRRNHDSPLGQLDWLYVSPEKLNDFYVLTKHYGELNYALDVCVHEPEANQLSLIQDHIVVFKDNKNWNYVIYKQQEFLCKGCLSKEKLDLTLEADLGSLEIEKNKYKLNSEQAAKLIYIILTQEKLCPNFASLFSVLKTAIAHHKEKIDLTKSSLCPTLFFYKPEEKLFDKLSNFYLNLGKFWPAYRNYLFRAYRNNESIDVMISSLRLPTSIQTLGRHGVCSEMLTMFGLHVLMQNKQTELVFMPNKRWIHQLDSVVDKIRVWSVRIYLIAYAESLKEIEAQSC